MVSMSHIGIEDQTISPICYRRFHKRTSGSGTLAFVIMKFNAYFVLNHREFSGVYVLVSRYLLVPVIFLDDPL